ncbi:MAG: aldo/keto reductase, partial [Lentisphaeria bacterium]|nr:aldo/keto reductase [Lentisphaeria bacterium]
MDGFSKLMLGTVQFGMNYGVANTTGKPSFEAVKTILKAAYDGGVTALDTAPEYGDSEEVIGRALDELGLAGRFRIVTKIPKLPEGCDAEKFIAESLENSLRRLRIERVDAALLHAEEDFIYLDALKSMVGRGLTAAAGVSLNTAAHRADGDAADCLQVPASLLDRRFDGCFGKGRHVFVRGAYLQGMLLMPEEKVFITEVLARRRELEKLGIPMAELALRYLFSKPEPKSILTGVETV